MPRVLLQRDAELAMLDHRVAQVRSGTGAVIVVEGPAGIGKSSLLAAAGYGAAAAGLRVLSAWGGPLERDAGWGIARQLFAPVRQSPEWDTLAVGAAAPARRALDDDGATPAPTGDAMHAAAHGLTWLTCGLAARVATLLLVDDVHWADAPSLRWLGQLTRRLGSLPLGILCAVRSGEPPAEPDLLAELLAAAGAPVRPSPLAPATVRTIVRDRLPAAGPAFAQACHAATAGNPFLLGALLDHLLAERVEPTDAVAAGLSGFGPEQVARAVDRQLARLPAGTAELARAFAVLGRGAKLRHARDLAQLDQERACRLADRLRGAGLVEGGADGYALVHPLVEAALYNGLPAGERALWHARAARLLTTGRADPETVALHLLRTEPAGEPETVTALRTAADRAWRRGAPQNAATFLRRALAEPPIATYDEAELLGQLGLVIAEQEKPQAYDLLADAVGLAADPEQRARIGLAGARALGLAGYAEEALDLSRRVLARGAGADPELLERLEGELVCNAWLDAAEVADARDRTDRGGGQRFWAVHRAHRAICDGRPAAEAIALLRTALDVESDSLLATFLKFDLAAVEELDAVRALCDELIDVARPRGWMTALAHGSFVRAHALVQAGRVREAVTDGRYAFEFKLANPPASGLVWTLFPLLDALVEADDLDGAEAALAAARRTGADEPVPGKLRTAMLLERRARLWLARHRPADAHTDLLAAAETWQALGVTTAGFAAWRVDDSAALAALGDLTAARRLAEEHLDLAARVGLPGPRGAGLRALARTVGPAEAVPLLTQAAHLLAGSPAQLEHARVLVELGAALRRANQRAAAREPLVRALELADRGGMRLIGGRARQELLAAGGRPRRSVTTGPGALTPAEHRVAVLAALGHSNREIADQLFVTRRTVETHLTHIFQKLSVSSRAQLATSLPAPIG
ncbi:hypothetical protein GCM10010168_27260 [Actinoplanes ianthinogenes]|uniref:HTH luxR-type domain-containing protein n=1 Tax=Actinoplanes ianthinogenes TaxID=122358 RepID=A0ABM7LKS9_9ACTN|nr:LuxR family transcriptional regulator [Actinoplanes ianthinogenes]BCJ39866.1 hypothetical protein Aiant_05230 [Actinoplanes ianthinogenes]GGR08678.1 hypothetical protein GCM10010168_27260 [Actinoplanes ianthinogenes]